MYAEDKNNPPCAGESSSSLANLASSPGRFAKSLNMTVEQVDEAIEARKMASTTLNDRLIALEEENKEKLTEAEIGRMKHQMICQHRFQYLRNPFVCRKCWTFLPICVCHLFEQQKRNNRAGKCSKAQLPIGVEKIIVWTHHDEFGRTSNTGSLLPLGLEQTDILMKGLPEHEQIMNEILQSEDKLPVVLWPDKNSKRASTTITDLRGIILETTSSRGQTGASRIGGIILISIEGTWNNARKMSNKLPQNVMRLDLSEEIRRNFTTTETKEGVFIDNKSLLAPLRRQGEGAKQECVSTLEATIIALLGLGWSAEDASFLLNCARTKVRRIQEYTGKTYPRD